MKFKSDLKIFIFLIIFVLTNQIKIYAYIMLFAIIHELGHLLMGIILKMKPEKLEINPMGVSVVFKLDPLDYNIKIKNSNLLAFKKIIIALAGPVTNLICIIIIYNLKINIINQIIMVYSNILLIIFNLIPIYPLDGGRILEGIFVIVFGKRKGKRVTMITTFVLQIILTAIASIAIIYYRNISIFFITIFLWLIIIKEIRVYLLKEKIYKKINEIDKNII